MMPRPQELDAEVPVIEAIRAGDPYAFREFVNRHHRWVRGVIFAVLGKRDRLDDVAQQVWAGAWQRIGELREPQAWRPWLYRLARNAAIDAGREASRRRRRTQALAEEPTPPPAATIPDRAASSVEEREAVRRAIAGLPALYREPFVLRHLSGWSYQQIADVLDMPVDSVETRLVRARRLLRESLAGEPG